LREKQRRGAVSEIVKAQRRWQLRRFQGRLVATMQKDWLERPSNAIGEDLTGVLPRHAYG